MASGAVMPTYPRAHLHTYALTHSRARRYLRRNNFYVMKHIDRRITDVGTRLSQEVTTLVESLSMTISMVFRPLFDAVYCTVLLLRVQLPSAGIIAMFAYGIGGVGLIRLLAPDFRHFTSDTERRVAALRQAHERVESHAEAIAFQVPVATTSSTTAISLFRNTFNHAPPAFQLFSSSALQLFLFSSRAR